MAIIVKVLGGVAWVYRIAGGKGEVLTPSGEWQRVIEGAANSPTTHDVLQHDLVGGIPGIPFELFDKVI